LFDSPQLLDQTLPEAENGEENKLEWRAGHGSTPSSAIISPFLSELHYPPLREVE
jgi:hypothetical protein